jgi:acetylornithine deacetylase
MSPVDRSWTLRVLRDLVAIDSINPAFGGPGEAELARRVARCLQALDLEVTLLQKRPGRPSVLGTLRGRGGGRSLLLYAHLDTVGVEGMEDPFGAAIREGRLYGRGAYDMKSGLAACLAAARSLVEASSDLSGDLHLGFVADEEHESFGMHELLSAVRPDGAVVTEPTDLRLCVAHKGFAWIAVETRGRAAHGSRFDEGVDSNLRMGRILGRLEGLERELRSRSGHPLLGPPSLHAARLQGGTGPSTYAARCRLEIERRTLPGETPEAVLAEIRGLVDSIRAEDPEFDATVEPLLWRVAFEADPRSELAGTLRREMAARLGGPSGDVGESYWMDAALLAAAGIDTVILGPAGAGAHAAEEWVELESVHRLADILAHTAEAYCR